MEQALSALAAYWEDLLSKYHVASSNEKVDRMVNIWNQYQCMVTFNMSRSASYYESGIGRGMGFRDSCQDLLGFVHLIPERARERILDIAATQFIDGSAYHQYQPLNKKGNSDIGSGFNDDPLWLIAGTDAYIRETGDFSILDEAVPFDNDVSLAAPLMEHLHRSFDYIVNHKGPHGLPLIGRADWNDCLNLNCFSARPGESFQTFGPSEGPVAESVFIAAMFVKYGNAYAKLCRLTGNTSEATRAEKEVAKIYDVSPRMAGMANGSCVPMMPTGRRSAPMNVRKDRSISRHRASALSPVSASRKVLPKKRWILSRNDWTANTVSSCSSLPTPDIIWNWARSLLIHRDIRKMRVFSVITTHGFPFPRP